MPNPSFSYPLSQPYIVSKVGSRMNSVPAPRLVLAKLGLSHSASDLHKLLEKVLPHLQKISKHRSDFLNVGFECRKYRAGWKKWMVKTVEPFWSYQSSWKMDLHPTKKWCIFNGSSSSSILGTISASSGEPWPYFGTNCRGDALCHPKSPKENGVFFSTVHLV